MDSNGEPHAKNKNKYGILSKFIPFTSGANLTGKPNKNKMALDTSFLGIYLSYKGLSIKNGDIWQPYSNA